MRTDDNVKRTSFRFSSAWREDPVSRAATPEIDRRMAGGEVVDGRFVSHSLSGHERNHLFVNSRGTSFRDVSAVSGLDNPADGRGFVLLDYDRDGWQDLALVNANEPLLNLYHNEIGRLQRDRAGAPASASAAIAVRCVGGNRAAAPSTFACRDGFGARISVEAGGRTLQREVRCGEGFATQNSGTLLIGLGEARVARALTVRWPSGNTQRLEAVAAGTLIVAYENALDSSDGSGFEREPYAAARAADVPPPASARAATFAGTEDGEGGGAELRLFTTMATWCAACKRQLPQLRRLREVFPEEDVALMGLPADASDTTEMLRAYVLRWNPPYTLRGRLSDVERARLDALLAPTTFAALPSTIVTDAQGVVLEVVAGVPSVSAVRKLLARPASR